METRFIVDNNVGKLAKWLRIMGYDTLFFDNRDDEVMILLPLRMTNCLFGSCFLTKNINCPLARPSKKITGDLVSRNVYIAASS